MLHKDPEFATIPYIPNEIPPFLLSNNKNIIYHISVIAEGIECKILDESKQLNYTR